MASKGSISGQVTNQQDGQPLKGVSLTLNGDGESSAGESGADGKFAFKDLKEGEYELTAHKDGFDNGIYGPLKVLGDCDTHLNLALQPKQEGK